jgi:hypothetical protein
MKLRESPSLKKGEHSLALCGIATSSGGWAEAPTDRLAMWPLDDATIERCSKAAYIASHLPEGDDDWDDESPEYRRYWCDVIRAAMTALMEPKNQ